MIAQSRKALFALVAIACLQAASASEVWSGSSTGTGIDRYDTQGTPLGTIATGDRQSALELVGDEVWAGASTTPHIRRYDMDGTFLGIVATSERVDAIKVVSDEVWVGHSTSPGIDRYTLDGALLGSLLTGDRQSALELVGDEVWAGASTTPHIRRYDMDGTFVGIVSTGDRVDSLLVVPEPGTVAVYALGSIVVVRRRRNGPAGCIRRRLKRLVLATGVHRAALRRFRDGRQSLRLDIADRLAAYFGIEPRQTRRRRG